jgi:hypothetical protein
VLTQNACRLVFVCVALRSGSANSPGPLLVERDAQGPKTTPASWGLWVFIWRILRAPRRDRTDEPLPRSVSRRQELSRGSERGAFQGLAWPGSEAFVAYEAANLPGDWCNPVYETEKPVTVGPSERSTDGVATSDPGWTKPYSYQPLTAPGVKPNPLNETAGE